MAGAEGLNSLIFPTSSYETNQIPYIAEVIAGRLNLFRATGSCPDLIDNG